MGLINKLVSHKHNWAWVYGVEEKDYVPGMLPEFWVCTKCGLRREVSSVGVNDTPSYSPEYIQNPYSN